MAGGRTRIPTFNCHVCPAKYLSQSGVDAHLAKEHGDGSYVAPPQPMQAYPPAYTPQYNTGNSGSSYQGRKKIPDYKCPQCPVKYLSQSGVENHMIKVHSDNSPWTPQENTYVPRQRSSTFNCTQCIKKYLSQDGLDSHVAREHGGGSSDQPAPPQPPTYQPRRRSSTFNCTQCIKKYLSQDGLDAHVKKEHQPAEEETNEDGLSWPPEKGSIIATLFEDNFYIGRVLRFENDNSAMVRYMERAKKYLNSKNEDRYWVWPENHETFQTNQESVLGVDLIIEKDNKISTDSDTVFELKDHETWSNLATDCKSQGE